MRKLGVVEFITLDGVMQGLGGPDEDREGGFDLGGWSGPSGDDVLAKRAGQGIGQTSAYLFGRKTYEHMAAHWPHESADNPIAASLNATPKYVATHWSTFTGSCCIRCCSVRASGYSGGIQSRYGYNSPSARRLLRASYSSPTRGSRGRHSVGPSRSMEASFP